MIFNLINYSENWQIYGSRFKSNKRAYYSLIIFSVIFVITSFAEVISNDKPLVLYFKGKVLFPIIENIREIDLGGDYLSRANFNDDFVKELVSSNGFMVMPIIPYHYKTIMMNLPSPAPSPPDKHNILGTDDHARDVLARLIYSVRITIVFALLLTVSSTVIGIAYGALQGYLGGVTDIIMQRFYEVWYSLPAIYILIILSSIIVPSFSWLLLIMLMLSWLNLVSMVRTEFMKARKAEYVLAAKVLGLSDLRIIFRHILPNALVSSLTYFPFLINAAITSLTALDFLGLGLPAGSPSLGEMVGQAKNNLHAYWIIASIFITLSSIMMLMIFIGEGIRDIFDYTKGNK